MLYTKFDHEFIFKKQALDYLALNAEPDKVFIYTVNLTLCKLDIGLLWGCLSPKEKIQANKYYTSNLRNRYIISHSILRCILGYYTYQLPQDVEFFYNDYGKPFLQNNNIQFNMSHSHDLVSYIISPYYKAGIDIEWHDMTLDIDELTSLVLTSYEHKLIAELKDIKKLEFFYNLWTIKESLIKASGHGLSYPINTIEIAASLPNHKIPLDSKIHKPTQEWYNYFPLEIAKDYSGAIAIEHKIKQVIYLEMDSQNHTFGQTGSKYID